MKVVILAGGKGSRLSEYTSKIPKPMVKIGSKPLIVHIINSYIKYGHKDFIIATGYKSNVIKKYFKKNSNKIHNANIRIINTGLNTLTALRIKKLEEYIKNETFMLTYGDGISNINLKKLLNFHKKNKKVATMTAVHPPVRFGELEFNNKRILKFEEKPQLQKGWINGGYFVLNSDIFKYLDNKNVMFERDPITKLVKAKQICAFPHENFWACVDTKRDKDLLEDLIVKKKFQWLRN
jgi:glucose-1-phosphate cytidylyltransferase